MVRNEIYDCSPIVRSGVMDLARVVDIDGRGRQGILAFEMDIAWIREIGAKVKLFHGGVEVTEHGSYCDVGRWGSCVTETVVEALRLCEHYGVDARSTMSIVVAATAEEKPMLAPGDVRKGLFGRRIYEGVPDDWLLHEPGRIDACLRARAERLPWPEGGLPMLRTVKVADEIAVWDSSAGDAENDASVAAFLKKWTTV